MRHARTTTLLLLLLSVLNCSTTTPPQPVHAGYVRGNTTGSARRVIILVHGVFGDATGTWTNPITGAYLPKLLRDDPAFHDADIWVHEYPSPKRGRSYTIDELADQLDRHLENDNVIAHHQQIIFLAHSMGGIIVRDYLLKSHLTPDRIPLLYFYSTPTTGSEIAALARVFSENQALVDLRPMTTKDPGLLGLLESHWQASPLHTITTKCAYETLPTHGIQVVQRASATHLCTRADPLNRNHITITKPANTDDDSYIVFRNAYRAANTDSGGLRPTWNLDGDDRPLALVMNSTTSPHGCKTCWSAKATVRPGDVIAVSVFAHNATETPAYGARTRLTIPNGPFAESRIVAELRAAGTMPVAGSVYVESKGGAVALIPTTGAWYPEAATDGTADDNLPYNQTAADALTPEGLLLGDISPGRGHQTTLILRFRCIPVTLVAFRDFASFLSAASTTAATQPAQADVEAVLSAGHVQQSAFEDQAHWVADITGVVNDEVVLILVSDYNDTDTPLHNVTVTTSRTPTFAGEELTTRIAAGGIVRRTGAAALEYLDKTVKRDIAPAGMIWFTLPDSAPADAALSTPADTICAKTLHEMVTNMTVLNAPPDGELAIGDVPPKTGFLLWLLVAGDEPRDEQVATTFETMEQSLKNANIAFFDDVSLSVARKGASRRESARVEGIVAGEQLELTLHFKIVGDAPARQTRARIVTSTDVHTITVTATLHGTNTPAQESAAKIILAPGQHAHLQYVEAFRSFGANYSPLDARSIADDDGLSLEDIGPNEEGWLQITYAVVSDGKGGP